MNKINVISNHKTHQTRTFLVPHYLPSGINTTFILRRSVKLSLLNYY